MTAMLRGIAAALTKPTRTGTRTLPPPGLVVLAAIGASLVLVIATVRWGGLQDEYAYWTAAERLLAGEPVYDPTADAQTPHAYWYPPPLAQLLAPVTPWLPERAFSLAWTALLLACLIGLARGRILVALALVAFLPIATELWYRNVHLVLAAMAVLALRRWPLMWVIAAAVKLTPAIAVAYLAAAGRWRDAARVSMAGAAVILVSVVVSPAAWSDFVEVVSARVAASTGGLVGVPFILRLAAAVTLAVAGGRLGGRRGETLLVVGLVVGNPTLWLVSFSMLAALLPIWWDGRSLRERPGDHDQRTGSEGGRSR